MLIRNLAVLALSLPALITGCGTPEADQSTTAYAHYQPGSSLGGPLGRLLAVKAGFETDFQIQKICVEVEKLTMTDDEIVFETKLAYAGWLHAAGITSEEDWEKFSFERRAKCRRDDRQWSAIVVLAEEGEIIPEDRLDNRFASPVATCTTSNGWKRCTSTGITLGWGGPGGVTRWYYNSNPNRWTKLEASSPSTAHMSPYVDWISIRNDLAEASSDEMAASTRENLIREYDRLAAQSSPTFVELVAYMERLAEHEALARDDQAFKQVAQGFYASSETSLTRTYRPRRAVFPTLAHEVGHQFGMAHADNPGTDTITGSAVGARQNDSGQWVNELATMAYALPYLYLTEDDKAGSLSNARHLNDLLATHR